MPHSPPVGRVPISPQQVGNIAGPIPENVGNINGPVGLGGWGISVALTPILWGLCLARDMRRSTSLSSKPDVTLRSISNVGENTGENGKIRERNGC
jgi:hypothetical protein